MYIILIKTTLRGEEVWLAKSIAGQLCAKLRDDIEPEFQAAINEMGSDRVRLVALVDYDDDLNIEW